jgi:hypothetical protein
VIWWLTPTSTVVNYITIISTFATCILLLLSLSLSLSLACLVCPALTLANGAVSYSDEGSSVERDIGSVATHACNFGFRLEVDNATSPQAMGNTRTCGTSGWISHNFTCGE